MSMAMPLSIPVATEGSPQNPIIIDESEGISKSLSSRRSMLRSKHSSETSPTPIRTKNNVNKGMQLLLGMGYQPGSGLGKRNDGITEPVSVIPTKRKIGQDDVSGIGCHPAAQVDEAGVTTNTCCSSSIAQVNKNDNTGIFSISQNEEVRRDNNEKKNRTSDVDVDKNKRRKSSSSCEDLLHGKFRKPLRAKTWKKKQAGLKEVSHEASRERVDNSSSTSVEKSPKGSGATKFSDDNVKEASRMMTRWSSNQNTVISAYDRDEYNTQRSEPSSSGRDTGTSKNIVRNPYAYSRQQEHHPIIALPDRSDSQSLVSPLTRTPPSSTQKIPSQPKFSSRRDSSNGCNFIFLPRRPSDCSETYDSSLAKVSSNSTQKMQPQPDSSSPRPDSSDVVPFIDLKRLRLSRRHDQHSPTAPPDRKRSSDVPLTRVFLNSTQKSQPDLASSSDATSNGTSAVIVSNPYTIAQLRIPRENKSPSPDRADIQSEQIAKLAANPYRFLPMKERSTRFDLKKNVSETPSFKSSHGQPVQTAVSSDTSRTHTSQAAPPPHTSTSQAANSSQQRKPIRPLAPPKQIGIPDCYQGGFFSPKILSGYKPDPSRTLVISVIPKRFRTERFVGDWASEFTRNNGRYLHIFLYDTKSLVEFDTRAEAEKAFSSPLMRDIHLNNIRAYWYTPGGGTESVPEGVYFVPKAAERFASTNSGTSGSRTSSYPIETRSRSGVLDKTSGGQRSLDNIKTQTAARPTLIIPGNSIRAIKEKQNQEQLQTRPITIFESTTTNISAIETERLATLPVVSTKSVSESLLPTEHANTEADKTNAEVEKLPTEFDTTTKITRVPDTTSLDNRTKTYHAPVPSSTGFRSGSLSLKRPADSVLERPSFKNLKLTLNNTARDASDRAGLGNELSMEIFLPPTTSSPAKIPVTHTHIVNRPSPVALAALQPEGIAVTAAASKNDPQEQVPRNYPSSIAVFNSALDIISTAHSKTPLNFELIPLGEHNSPVDAVSSIVTFFCKKVTDSSSGVMKPEHEVSVNGQAPRRSDTILYEQAVTVNPFTTKNDMLESHDQIETGVTRQTISEVVLTSKNNMTELHIQNELDLADKTKSEVDTVIPQVMISPREQYAGDITSSVNASIASDDAATAFITEAIRCASPSGHVPITPSNNIYSDVQASEIECRRARLEENIAQNSALLAQLNKVKTRQERTEILEKIRGINRALDSYMKKISNATLIRTQSTEMRIVVTPKVTRIWPVEMPNGSMILDISDDESVNDH